jgi:hypothetical protein
LGFGADVALDHLYNDEGIEEGVFVEACAVDPVRLSGLATLVPSLYRADSGEDGTRSFCQPYYFVDILLRNAY